MLARVFADTGSLRDRAADIYRRALLSLSDEVNPGSSRGRAPDRSARPRGSPPDAASRPLSSS